MTTFVVDFDSTLVQAESLDVLGEVSLAGRPDRDARLAEVSRLTDQAMAGEADFAEAMATKLTLLDVRREHLAPTAERLAGMISPSALRNRGFFADGEVWIISGGFQELIGPAAAALGIPPERVLANRFVFDGEGRVTGVDLSLPTSRNGGKAEAVRALDLSGPVVAVGDGWTDWELEEAGAVERFYAFTETIARDRVLAKARFTAADFDDLIRQEQPKARFTYPRDRIRVLLLEGVHSRAVERFGDEGYAVQTVRGALEPSALAGGIAGVHILGIRSKTQVSAEALAGADRLLGVGAFCIGTNQIDLRAAAGRGVAVFNAPYSNTRSVVELAIGEIVALARGLTDRNADLHAGRWVKSAAGSTEIRGKTLGIVGYGAIGSQLSVLAEALGMTVIFHDVAEKLALGNARKQRSLDELLAAADVVTLHVDGREANTALIGPEQLARMKPGALLLNLSRGHVVDVEALAEALRTGRLGGAAVDVFPDEPGANGEAFSSPLQGLPNVILTPHVGGSTEEAQEAIAEFVTDRLLGFLERGDTGYAVNLPQVQLPEVAGAHRLLHVHENRPGVLAAINRALAESGANILGQYLRTDERVGYAVTDVNAEAEKALTDALRAVPGTLKFRTVY